MEDSKEKIEDEKIEAEQAEQIEEKKEVKPDESIKQKDSGNSVDVPRQKIQDRLREMLSKNNHLSNADKDMLSSEYGVAGSTVKAYAASVRKELGQSFNTRPKRPRVKKEVETISNKNPDETVIIKEFDESKKVAEEINNETPKVEEKISEKKEEKPKSHEWLWWVIGAVLIAVAIYFFWNLSKSRNSRSVAQRPFEQPTQVAPQPEPKPMTDYERIILGNL